MLICHCESVNDRAIRAAIAAGAREPAELAVGCGAGRRCGGCVPAILELLDELTVGSGGATARRHETAA